MLEFLCLKGPFGRLLDMLEEVGSSSRRLPSTGPGEEARGARLGLRFFQGCTQGLAAAPSPGKLIQPCRPRAGSHANLRMCLLPQTV